MTTKNKYLKLNAQVKDIADEMNALKIRFYNFIHENDVSGFTPAKIRFGQETADVESYSFSVEESTETNAVFRSAIMDYSDYEEVYFHMPVEYMEDPTVWENYITKELSNDMLLSREILVEIFGTSASVLFSYLEQARPAVEKFSAEEFNRYLFIAINRATARNIIPQTPKESAFFRPNREQFSLIYDRKTGNVYDTDNDEYMRRPTTNMPFYTR